MIKLMRVHFSLSFLSSPVILDQIKHLCISLQEDTMTLHSNRYMDHSNEQS